LPIPNPEPGLVISYAYPWHHEHQAGREEGRKDRPSVIVLTVERKTECPMIVTVLPITHSRPADTASAVEFPLPVKSGISGSTTIAQGLSSARAMNFSGQAMICENSPTATATTWLPAAAVLQSCAPSLCGLVSIGCHFDR
jgi:hypothetical protein